MKPALFEIKARDEVHNEAIKKRLIELKFISSPDWGITSNLYIQVRHKPTGFNCCTNYFKSYTDWDYQYGTDVTLDQLYDPQFINKIINMDIDIDIDLSTRLRARIKSDCVYINGHNVSFDAIERLHNACLKAKRLTV